MQTYGSKKKKKSPIKLSVAGNKFDTGDLFTNGENQYRKNLTR